jgi:hypothetical protein
VTDIVLYELVAEGRDLNDPNLFSDITTSPWTYTDNNGEITLHFDADLTLQQQRFVTWRATTTPNEETILRQMRDVLTDLRQIRDSTGNLSAANLSAAVRALARADIALIRNAVRDFTGTE